MTKINIDLAMGGPEIPEGMPERDEYYPSFTYSGDEKLDIPHEGEMVVRYKKTSSSQREDKSGEHYSCTIEVQEIISVGGKEMEKPAKSYDEAGPALDKLAAEIGRAHV